MLGFLEKWPSNIRVGGNLRVVGWEMTKNVEKMEKNAENRAVVFWE